MSGEPHGKPTLPFPQPRQPARTSAVPYAELGVTTNFSFLRGASRPEELVVAAAYAGLRGIGIADRNSLAGIVRAHSAMRHKEMPQTGLKLVVGARLLFTDGTPDILAYPSDRAAYGRLCQLLTRGKRAAPKGECHLTVDDLAAHAAGQLMIVMPPPRPGAETRQPLERLARLAPDAVWLGASLLHRSDDRRRLAALARLAADTAVPLIATNDVIYHSPERRPLQDVLTAIREHVTVMAAGRLLEANAERHLKTPEEMALLFADRPEALAETVRLLGRVRFSLDELSYEYPDEPVPPGKTPQQHLEDLTWAGAEETYSQGLPDKVRKILAKELELIAELDYAAYFLTVHDVVRFARSAQILCQGRGSAANSAVCYVLGITAVDPHQHQLLFSRFISSERKEPPDIDVDFEHQRREEVIQYVYARYGRARAGLTATVISYRARSAIREVGKALGLTEDITSALAGTVWGYGGGTLPDQHIRQAGLDPANPAIAQAVALASELIGFPRHLSQHVGGFVLTRGRLDTYVPIGNAAMDDRTFIEWDKDDIDALGMMKVDVLALGMLTCIRMAFDLIAQTGGPRKTLATVEEDDREVYAMLSAGKSLGVFQVESRAQMNMLPRMKPQKFYDLVIQVAIVRPGPIQGDMVHPYLKRRQGIEPVVFPSPSADYGPADELKAVLGRTLGVPLFQEQAMQLAMVAAEFKPEEANQLRRAMATFRNVGTIGTFRDKMIGRMVERGYAQDFAERCFKQIEGFGSYGFPESHAASFAKLVYVSSWIKCHHPAAFACALLNAQPMGFYAPAQIVRDARENGVEVRHVDVNASVWDNALEPSEEGKLALRIGFRQIDGLSQIPMERFAAFRGNGYPDLDSVARRSGLGKRALLLLADADAFGSLGLNRRDGLWAVRRLPDETALPLFAAAEVDERGADADAGLPAMGLYEEVSTDYQTLRLSLKGHPMQFLRPRLARERVLACAEVAAAADGRVCRTAGVVLVRQQPGSAKGVIFMTIEDETGIVNVVIWSRTMARFRREVMTSRVLMVEGRIQRSKEDIVHLVADRLVDRTKDFGDLARQPDPSDLLADTRAPGGHPRNVRLLPRSRDFH
ncbi:error-prone DNA polymerase [Chelatococcus reniformis]|uniref:Error-prone DNA polymerase n=1 Tax=Chelatococcus reniformis TaxID=1494448 RepID=A0A916XM84_9HYPH|nr:error-prone DNA polymerase [Chelatococcus reniformis]GGC83552.1 error-prone DNA polymerase [Chelatococcus reniformis]